MEYFDINNQKINIGDTITYDDTEHSIIQSNGTVRNNLIGVSEVVNVDLQSGNNLDNITNITKWL